MCSVALFRVEAKAGGRTQLIALYPSAAVRCVRVCVLGLRFISGIYSTNLIYCPLALSPEIR